MTGRATMLHLRWPCDLFLRAVENATGVDTVVAANGTTVAACPACRSYETAEPHKRHALVVKPPPPARPRGWVLSATCGCPHAAIAQALDREGGRALGAAGRRTRSAQ